MSLFMWEPAKLCFAAFLVNGLSLYSSLSGSMITASSSQVFCVAVNVLALTSLKFPVTDPSSYRDALRDAELSIGFNRSMLTITTIVAFATICSLALTIFTVDAPFTSQRDVNFITGIEKFGISFFDLKWVIVGCHVVACVGLASGFWIFRAAEDAISNVSRARMLAKNERDPDVKLGDVQAVDTELPK